MSSVKAVCATEAEQRWKRPKYTEVQTNIEEQKQEYVTMLHKLVAKTADPRKTI